MKYNIPKSMGCSKSDTKREVYRNTCLPQEIRKISSKQPGLTPNRTSKRRKKRPKVMKRKEIIIKNRAEVSEIES